MIIDKMEIGILILLLGLIICFGNFLLLLILDYFDINIWKVHELIFIIGSSITFIGCIILFTTLLI